MYSKLRFALAFLPMVAVPLVHGAVIDPADHRVQKLERPQFVPNKLLVKYRQGVTGLQAIVTAENEGAHEVKEFPWGDKARDHRVTAWRHVRFPTPVDIERARRTLEQDPLVERVEYNYIVTTQVIPNDQFFANLWGLNNTQQFGGKADADIDAPEAWDVNTGNASAIVAVIDTGVDYTHPDLAANMWVNTAEIPGNGIDDDNNGCIDDVYGCNWVSNNGNPMDDNGHGTHVAGTIGAVGNNGIGVVGVNWNARIMALKFLDSNGSDYTSNAINAIAYATHMGAKVMNNSWGSVGALSQAMEDA